jgi:subtilisin family serine protease
MYPARYSQVISVGASTKDGQLADFSNAGEEMDIMAPGTDIVSADVTNGNIQKGFGTTNGTSMSAPHVTAAVAMMLGIDPCLSTENIRDILLETANYSMGEVVGEINLTAALERTADLLLGDDWRTMEQAQLKDHYRNSVQEKMASSGETLWQ